MIRKKHRKIMAMALAAILGCSMVNVHGADSASKTDNVQMVETVPGAGSNEETAVENPVEAAVAEETLVPVLEITETPESAPETAETPEPAPETAETSEPALETAETPKPIPETTETSELTPEATETPETDSEALETPAPVPETDSEALETPAPVPETDPEAAETPASVPETDPEAAETPVPVPETDSEAAETPIPSPEATATPAPEQNDNERPTYAPLKMDVLDKGGNSLEITAITSPVSLTCDGITHSVDYASGVYMVKAPHDTTDLQMVIKEPVLTQELKLNKWNGYLVEDGIFWQLYPDTSAGNVFSVSGNVYNVSLSDYMIDWNSMSVEQLTVYGSLNQECSYAEIFVHSQDVSAVILVEIAKLAEESTEEIDTDEKTDVEDHINEGTTKDTETTEIKEADSQAEFLEKLLAKKEAHLLEIGGAIEEEELSAAGAASAQIDNALKKTGENLANSAAQYIPTVSSINGEWQILGLVRSGQEVNPKVYEQYINTVIKTLKESNGVLHKKKYTEYSRVILALTALGVDVTNVGGYNLLEPLANFDKTVWQGVNGAIYALIAFDSHDYEIPTTNGKTQATRSNLISHILSLEISGGGWALSGKTPDPDMTAMAIQALAPYYKSDTLVKEAVDRGIAKLSALQMSNGGYGSYGVVNSESCSQVIVALTAMGIDPNTDARFVKNGRSVVDALLTFATSNGAFRHEVNGNADQMATEQAYYALTSYQRYKNGNTSLYDMSDVVLASDCQKAAAVEKLITALPETITVENKEQVQAVLDAYNSLTALQKTLVAADSYETLQNAVKVLEELDVKLENKEESDNKTDLDIEIDKDKGNDKNTASDKNTGTNKTPTGATKQVNLVSGSGSAGGGSVYKSDVEKEASETDEEDKETRTVKKKGNTKISLEAKPVIIRLRSLLSPIPENKKLPESASDYSDVQIAEIMEVYCAFEELSEVDKEVVKKYVDYTAFSDVLQKIKEVNHYDESTQTDLRDNEEEILPWYVSMEVSPQLMGEEQQLMVRNALKEQGEMFNLYDISLLNQKDGGEWHPEDLVRVSIPMTDIGEYENAAVIHMKDDGSIEFIKAYVAGNSLEFDTDEFSKFGIVGFHGSMESLMEDQQEEQIWIYLIPGIGAAVLFLIILIVRIFSSGKKKGDRS